MNMKGTISLIFIIFLLSACYTEHEFGDINDLGHTISKIYTYNIPDSSTRYITDGFSPITLLKSNKLLYQYSNQLWLYDFSINDSILLADNFFAFVNENCLSPDEKYLAYINDSTLNRININTTEINTLLTSDQLVNIPTPKYSDDGKYLLYLSNPKRKNNSSNSDSFYVNIYNFNSNTITKLDTIFKRTDYSITMGFINNSQQIYIIRQEERKLGGWEMKITIFNNSSNPIFFAARTLYSSTYDNKIWKLDEHTMLILAGLSIYKYDIISDKATIPVEFKSSWEKIRKIKNLDSLIVLDVNNSFEITNIYGEKEHDYSIKTKEEIDWIDYSAKFKYILFETNKYYHP